jgi:hypothetical protein
MDSTPANNLPKPDAALPPVQPPSGRFIIQLFVIPGLIILGGVLLLMFISYLRRERDPSYFLQQLDSANPDVRWRGLTDLAQIIKRNEPAAQRWKADASFALDLTERLEAAFQELIKEEKEIAAQIATSKEKNPELAWRKLRGQRDYVSFLASAMGEFHTPVGAPVLCTIAKHDASPDLKGNTLQRRKAVWALMNLGGNVQTFAKLPVEQQQTAIAALKEEAGKGSTPRAGWARTALCYLEPTPATPGAGVVKVDETLAICADADDRFLRELVAMSFNFWDGPQAEATLLKLAQDTGRGTLIRVEEND